MAAWTLGSMLPGAVALPAVLPGLVHGDGVQPLLLGVPKWMAAFSTAVRMIR